MKTLVVFDFDHTLVDDNSDTWVIKCAPGQRLPDALRTSYQKGRWTEYMARVMSYIGEQGVSQDAVRSVMEMIPFTEGMIELLTFIARNKSCIDCIIISDSNAVFIDWILRAAGVHGAIDEVFTNPAWFDTRGYLVVQRYHAHGCGRCPVNLCKRKVLDDFVEARVNGGVRYERTLYIGDGGNDLCPVYALTEGDTVMPRKGFALEKLLSKLCAEENDPLKARIIGWSSGIEILKVLKV